VIDDSRLDSGFPQPSNGCVLAAYAIVNNYFTRRPAADTFDAYCEHHNRPERWRASGEAFYHDACSRPGPAWSERVLDLHRTSPVAFFRDSRASFSGCIVPDGTVPVRIPQLIATESILVIGHVAVPRGAGMVHVISVGATPRGFVVKDTNMTTLFYARTFDKILAKYGSNYHFVDGAIYTAIASTHA
jgi:hypothetical protein